MAVCPARLSIARGRRRAPDRDPGRIVIGRASSSATGDGVIFAATLALPAPAATPTVTSYAIMHNFGGTSVKNLVTQSDVPDGYNPYGSLVMDNGYLYGMARKAAPTAAA